MNSADQTSAPPTHARPGLLRKVTGADQGAVNRPILTPHLEFRALDSRRVLLVSESFNTLLRGQIHADLFPLLDGNRSATDIAARLAGTHSASDVEAMIVSLASRGYVVSADYAMERSTAAYWSSLGASPRWAEQRLGAATVAISADDGRLAGSLGAIGVSVDAERPWLSVTVCADYLDERLADINRRHLETETPWMLVKPNGMQPLFGPVFGPARQGPCWSCLAYRLQGHQEVHSFLRNHAGTDAAFVPSAAHPAVLDAVYALVAAEVAKWLVFTELAPIHDRVISLDAIRLKTEHHPTMRRPQCLECGDETLFRPDRTPIPVRLKPSPKGVANSGGLRSVSPAETLARYRHLVSPISGVVTWLTRTTDEADPWLHVYWAGSNVALRGKELSSLRRSLRSKSAGKGSTRRQSEASALCEALERYSGAFHGDEIRCRRRLADFLGAGQEQAIHPNEVQLFSDWQLDNAEQVNARGHPYNRVPGRFDPEAEIDWSPVWSLTRDRHRYLPTSMLYGMPAEHRGNQDLTADSNGCAAGNTLEEAILQGFFELAERDAFAIWWYNRLSVPELDLQSFGDEYLDQARDYYRGFQRDLWVLDVTGDLGIPAFVAVSRRTDKDAEDIIYGAGAHTDARIAALRAVCELNQCLNWVQGTQKGGAGYAVDDPLCLWWWKNAKLSDHSYLAPAPGPACRGKSNYPAPAGDDLREEVARCRALVEARGMEFLVLDQTRPDIGMPVVRVIVPGLRHFWERFAPGRLFDVPAEMGWRDKPITEAELNPAPVIA